MRTAGKLVYVMPHGEERSSANRAAYFSDKLWEIFCELERQVQAPLVKVTGARR